MEPLARKLQGVGVSVPSVKSLIASLQSVLDENRVDFNTVAFIIYDEACAVVGTKEVSVPRVVGIQVHRDNVEVESASQYFQRSIFFPYIDATVLKYYILIFQNPIFLKDEQERLSSLGKLVTVFGNKKPLGMSSKEKQKRLPIVSRRRGNSIRKMRKTYALNTPRKGGTTLH